MRLLTAGGRALLAWTGYEGGRFAAGAIDPRSAGALAVYADVYPGSVRASARP